jgi:hypothetical protein
MRRPACPLYALILICRSNHFTEQSNQDDVTDDDDNDNANAAGTDRPPDSSTATVPHDATTTANAIVSSTSNTKSKKHGSHPASRRQRKRAATAAVAASAASSPEHMSPTTSPSPDPKETERKLYNLLYAASTTNTYRYRTDTTRSDERPGCLSATSRCLLHYSCIKNLIGRCCVLLSITLMMR